MLLLWIWAAILKKKFFKFSEKRVEMFGGGAKFVEILAVVGVMERGFVGGIGSFFLKVRIFFYLIIGCE